MTSILGRAAAFLLATSSLLADVAYLIVSPSGGSFPRVESGADLTITTSIGVRDTVPSVPEVPQDFSSSNHFYVSGTAVYGVDYRIIARKDAYGSDAYGYGVVTLYNNTRFTHHTYRDRSPNLITVDFLNDSIQNGNRTLKITKSASGSDEVDVDLNILIKDDDLAPSPSSTLSNLSSRGQVGSGQNVMIAGFAQSTSAPNAVLIRGIGPSLAQYGVAFPIANPAVALFSSTGVNLAANDNWGSAPNAAAISGTGLAPTNSLEAAILMDLTGTTYSAHLSNSGNGSIGLFEVYDMTGGTSNVLRNLSTRALVGSGDSALIAGFVISGGPKRLLITGKGPSLSQYGVSGALANPKLALYNSSGTLVESNNNWGSAWNSSAISSQPNRPTHADEAAIFEVLPAGAYTVILDGANSGTGIGLVELFDQ